MEHSESSINKLLVEGRRLLAGPSSFFQSFFAPAKLQAASRRQTAKAGDSRIERSLAYQSITEDVYVHSLDLSRALYDVAIRIIKESQDERISAIKFSDPREVSEPNQFLSSISPAISDFPARSYYRWRATAQTKSLSVRAAPHYIEFFIVPNRSVIFLSISEFGSRLAAKLVLRLTESGYIWLHNGERVDPDGVENLLRQCLADIVDEVSEPVAEKHEDTKLAKLHVKHNKQMDGLLLANQNLLFKLVNEQEATKNEIARELHDSVLADLMMLQRYLSGDRELAKQELADIVDDITKQLRDIVNECTPKTLQEWGLRVSLESLLQKLPERAGSKCTFDCPENFPGLPEMVELNVYRIFQECINNINKYARASKVVFSIRVTAERITFTLTDNGQGFSDRTAVEPSHGFGLRSMNERAELIRCFYPAKFNIESKTGEGTTALLEIELSCPSGHELG
jgi:signal transduction histidine kinase